MRVRLPALPTSDVAVCKPIPSRRCRPVIGNQSSLISGKLASELILKHAVS